MILGAIIYTFRDLAGPILQQLKRTPLGVIGAICFATILYELVEGWITYSFAKCYNPDFKYWQGVECAFYCCFYRVATLGSGAGFAAVYYFHENKIDFSKGTGMYMIEYVLHKITIALFSVIFFLWNFQFMKAHYSNYFWLLLLGYVITVLVAVLLLLLCCSKKFHKMILWLIRKINELARGRFDDIAKQLADYCSILKSASKELLKNRWMIIASVGKNLLKFAFAYAIPYLILRDEYHLTLSQAFAVTSLSIMLAAVIPSPAGIGSTEFVFTLLFSTLVGAGVAGSTSLLYRFATFVFPFMVGAVVTILRRRRKSVRKRQNESI